MKLKKSNIRLINKVKKHMAYMLFLIIRSQLSLIIATLLDTKFTYAILHLFLSFLYLIILYNKTLSFDSNMFVVILIETITNVTFIFPFSTRSLDIMHLILWLVYYDANETNSCLFLRNWNKRAVID